VAAWILVSGLDDLFITLVYLVTRGRRFVRPDRGALRRRPQRPIAIFIPLWHEDGVIEQMLRRNLAGIRYRNYHVFAGVYPNDLPTLRAVSKVARQNRRLHVAVVPHDGPTSKGDCLNSTWRSMREFELRHGIRFRVIMTHDAEDVIHPESLRLINWYSRHHGMVQIPVLPLPTPALEWTHGLYCDEFAEYQTKDIPVRQTLGGFLPANGVGTGFAREALDRLAADRGGQPFDPACLTEDYETGFEIHRMGYQQIFIPLSADLVATREYFPRMARASVRQRCRWVTGIALQGWERHGWNVGWRQAYWFWRDRKGLVGNLLTPVDLLLVIYSIARYPHMIGILPDWFWTSCEAMLGISLLQTAIRTQSTARIYGWGFASIVPLRVFWANLVNCAATARALIEYVAAWWDGAELTWKKTEHTYPVSPQWAPEPDPVPSPSTFGS
jgi:adsorption protein B